jgi:hypothetical protein
MRRHCTENCNYQLGILMRDFGFSHTPEKASEFLLVAGLLRKERDSVFLNLPILFSFATIISGVPFKDVPWILLLEVTCVTTIRFMRYRKSHFVFQTSHNRAVLSVFGAIGRFVPGSSPS